jgi:rhodanese-related sulfurtransferase
VEPREIDVDELAARLEQGAVLIDVRRQEEHDETHIEQAILIPLDQVPDRLDEVPTDGEVFVICRSGGRSAAACEFLAAQGISAVNVTGGMIAWTGSGRPTGGSMGTGASA